MGSAYTPGLTVSGDVIVRRVRRLPIKGEVLVQVGDAVEPNSAVARAMLPGNLQTIKLTEKLGLEPKDAIALFGRKIGDEVATGDIVAESKGFMGLFKQSVASDYTGRIEAISEVSGQVLIREPSIPIEIDAYIRGRVAEVLPGEGAIVETRGAMVQGIFGVGGERTGTIRIAVQDQDARLEATHLNASDKGKIVVGGSGLTLAAIQRAAEVGAAGIVAGGVRDVDLTKFLGFDIGVAITGQEAISFTLMVTEGFGDLAMARRTFELLASLDGKLASMNGATQIRAGVIRPEIVAPLDNIETAEGVAQQVFELKQGTPIRIIREPYFGKLGTVTELPAQLVTVESGTEVRVLKARLATGEEVTVPRANVEIIAS